MTRASQSEQRIKLKRSEKIFTGLGVTMVIVSSTVWFLTESLAPDFTKPTWDIASPGLTLLTLLVGSYLVLRGTKRLINASVTRLDNSLKPFVAYRIPRWFVMKAALIDLLILEFIFSAIGGDTPDENNAQNSPIPSSSPREGAWDVASDHYYDKEPPPPFS